MIELISSKDQERLASKLRQIGQRNIALDAALMEQAAGIIDEVQARGDAALVEYTERFDELSKQVESLLEQAKSNEYRIPELVQSAESVRGMQ